MKDGEFLLRVLADGRPHSLNEILRRSFAERGCGLTVHSRAADLRREGYRITNWKDGIRGDGSWYRLLLESATVDGLSPVADSSGRPAGSAVSPLGGGAAAAAQLVLPVGTKGAYT